jgi:hypothetical protein
MRGTIAALIAPLALLSSPAAAQAVDNLLSGFAGAADVGGRALGEGLSAGPSLFVTATGHAPRPRPQAIGFAITVEGRAATAGEAQRQASHQADLALAAARHAAIAAVEVDQGFASGADDANPMAALLKFGAKDDKPAEPTAPSFTATATIRFRAADLPAEAGLLDALTAAGGKFKLEGKARSILPGLDLDRVQETIDPGAWDRATGDAMAEAHRQAALLAAAAGAKLGEARQIVQLGRTIDADQIGVTIAVRYGLITAQ